HREPEAAAHAQRRRRDARGRDRQQASGSAPRVEPESDGSCASHSAARRRQRHGRYPPTEERTRPNMTTPQVSSDDIRSTVRAFVARITEREPDEITDTTDFQNDLDIDSLMAMEMMVSVNKKYRIEIMDEE